MRTLTTACATLAIIAVPVLRPASLTGQEWSPAQREVLAALDEYTHVSIEGNVGEIMSYFHVKFQGWDYSQDRPLDRGETQALLEDYYAANEMTAFDVEPLAVQVRSDVAVIHLRYRETMRLADGAELTVSGPCTMTLVKEGGRWLFLSWAWIQKET